MNSLKLCKRLVKYQQCIYLFNLTYISTHTFQLVGYNKIYDDLLDFVMQVKETLNAMKLNTFSQHKSLPDLDAEIQMAQNGLFLEDTQPFAYAPTNQLAVQTNICNTTQHGGS